MPKKPFFRKFDGWWYAQIAVGLKRKQVKLVKGKENEKEAYRAFCRLMTDEGQIQPDAVNQSVATLCDLFLDTSQRQHKPHTFEQNRYFLQDFCTRFGRLMACELKPFHIARWLDAHPGWKASRRHAITTIKRVFNWAEDQGFITANPIRKVKKPRGGKRMRVINAEERRKILEAIPDQAFREFVFALQETGCRPSEVAMVTAVDVHLEAGLWVFEEHKTAHKGKSRIIYLSPAMLELSRMLVERHPQGPLFRGKLGQAFNRNSIICRFRRLREKLPELKHFSAYAYRHTYTTEALINGVGIVQVAELLGHSSTDMVMRHYQHLSQKIDHMRQAAKTATSGPASGVVVKA